VLIPRLLNAAPVIEDDPSNLVKLSWREAVVGAKDNSLQPKLTGHAFTTYMDVLWFVTIEAVKEKPVCA